MDCAILGWGWEVGSGKGGFGERVGGFWEGWRIGGVGDSEGLGDEMGGMCTGEATQEQTDRQRNSSALFEPCTVKGMRYDGIG